MYNQKFDELEGELELVELLPTRYRSKADVTITKAKTQLDIHSQAGKLLSWPDGVRLNLYMIGTTTFVLKPHKVGIITARKLESGGYRISKKDLCMTIMARSNHAREFEAWVEGEVIMFRPVEVQE